MKQQLQCAGECKVLLGGSFGRSFCASACGPVLSGGMTLLQKTGDIILGVQPAILMEDPIRPGKTHGGKSIILGDHNITGEGAVYKGKIHTVSAFVKYKGGCPIFLHCMGGVAQKYTFYSMFFAELDRDVHYRTGIRINQYLHAITNFLTRL